MRARRTPWWSFVLAAALGVLAGMGLAKYGEISGLPLVGAPWIVPVVLAVLGGVVLYMALQIHKYTTKDPVKRAQLKPLDPQKAFGTLVACKALGLAGAALAGWYGGQIIMSLPHGEAEFYSQAIIECVVACVVCVADMIVGIVGESGCGKSTLLKLLMRFWDVNKGNIKISEENVKEIPTKTLRNTQSYVTQETELFHDSIANNIAIGKPGAAREEIIKAAQKASIHDMIMSLPNGYDTEVGELGDTLSGGEKQRIGIARAFLHDSPMLLLDEPTSNLDSLNEGIILKSLKEESQGRTVVLVSHRESTMGIADEVYHMDAGRVS